MLVAISYVGRMPALLRTVAVARRAGATAASDILSPAFFTGVRRPPRRRPLYRFTLAPCPSRPPVLRAFTRRYGSIAKDRRASLAACAHLIERGAVENRGDRVPRLKHHDAHRAMDFVRTVVAAAINAPAGALNRRERPIPSKAISREAVWGWSAALLAGGAVSRDPEPAGIVGFHLFGSVPEPFTVWQDIRSVPAGATIIVDKTGPHEPKTYYNVAASFAARARHDHGSTMDAGARLSAAGGRGRKPILN